MLDSQYLIKFIISFIILIFALFGIYYYLNRYGKPIAFSKGEIKIKDIKFITKDKGFVLIETKDKEFFFSFNSSKIDLINIWEKKEKIYNENKNTDN